MKINIIPQIVAGKKVALIDDSIVRGTTSKILVGLIRSCGAKEIHLLIPSPPVCYPDFYGIDTPKQSELIAANMSLSNLEKYIGVDSLHYLSFENMAKAIGVPLVNLCTSCFTGEYPINIGKNIKSVKKIMEW